MQLKRLRGCIISRCFIALYLQAAMWCRIYIIQLGVGWLALLLFGGKKLPEMMKGLGQGVQSFKLPVIAFFLGKMGVVTSSMPRNTTMTSNDKEDSLSVAEKYFPFENIWKKVTQKFGGFKKMAYLCTRKRKGRAFSSVGSEHLPYKQRVGGSNPSTPTPQHRNLLKRGCDFCLSAIDTK